MANDIMIGIEDAPYDRGARLVGRNPIENDLWKVWDEGDPEFVFLHVQCKRCGREETFVRVRFAREWMAAHGKRHE